MDPCDDARVPVKDSAPDETPLWPAFFVGAAVFAVYSLTACPTIYWLDSSEFAAASATLGIAHPPGHAATLVVGRLLALLPFGSIAFRVNLASAAAGAVAAGATFVLAHRLVAATVAGHRLRMALATGAAATFALSYAAWLQSVRAEVYALEAALLIATLALVARAVLAPDPGRDAAPAAAPGVASLGAAGLLLGLGLANHHLSTLLLLLPTLALALALPSLRGKPLLRALLAGVLGAGLLLYLPVRAHGSPPVDWGHPDSWSRFFWVVSAKPFQKTALTRARFDVTGVADTVVLLAGELSPAGALLAVLGAAGSLHRRGTRAVAGYLIMALGLNVCAVLITGFDPSNPDAYGYLLPSVAIGATLAAVALAEIASAVADAVPRGERIAGLAVALVAVAVAPLQAWRSRRAGDLGAVWAADTFARADLSLPSRAALAAGSFETVFNLWYLQHVEGARPDVQVLRRGFVEHPGYLADVARTMPELLPLATAMRAADARLPSAILMATARARPLFTEVVPSVDLAGSGRGALWLLVPWGPLFRVEPAAPAPAVRTASDESSARFATSLERALGRSRTDPETRKALLWNEFILAEVDCKLGRAGAAARPYDAARSIAPDDKMLADLGARCGLR